MKWQSVLAAAVVALVLLSRAHSQPAAVDVREFVRADTFPGSYRELIGSYDTSVTPQLNEMLNSATENANSAQIAALLGAVGDERAAEPLIRFIERPATNFRLSFEQEQARNSAIRALGHLLNRTGSERALKYLVDSLTPSVWRQRRVEGIASWANSYEESDKELSKQALFALALSGNSAAGEALRSLQQSPTAGQAQLRNGLDETLAQWLGVHQLVAERGLAGMYEHYESEKLGTPARAADGANRD